MPTCSAKLSRVNDRESTPDAEAESKTIPGIDRLLTLTDGVVAIALTLLVLQFRVPVDSVLQRHPQSASVLWHSLSIDRDELISYFVAFLVIAQFWLVHHRVLRTMHGHHEGLARRNFGFLLALTLMPFTSGLLGRYGNNPVAVTLFGLNLAALSIGIQWISRYALRHGLMVDRVRSAHEELLAQVPRRPAAGRGRRGDSHRLDRGGGLQLLLADLPLHAVARHAYHRVDRTVRTISPTGQRLRNRIRIQIPMV